MNQAAGSPKSFKELLSGKGRTWTGILGLILAGIFLYLALRGMDWAAFARTLRQANWPILLVAFPVSSLSYWMRGLRWRGLLNTPRPPAASQVFWINMVGYLGNAFLPARAGELVRSYLLGRYASDSTVYALATALTERVLDLVILVTGAAIALYALPGAPVELLAAVQSLAVVAVAALLVIILAPNTGQWLARLIARLPLPAGLAARLTGMLENVLRGLASLRSVKRLGGFFLLSIFIWALDTAGCLIFAGVIGQRLTFAQAFLLLACLGISSAVPSTPGYIGVYQFVAVSLLVPFGFLRSEALAYILLLQGMGYLVIGFWGLIGLWRLRKAFVK